MSRQTLIRKYRDYHIVPYGKLVIDRYKSIHDFSDQYDVSWNLWNDRYRQYDGIWFDDVYTLSRHETFILSSEIPTLCDDAQALKYFGIDVVAPTRKVAQLHGTNNICFTSMTSNTKTTINSCFMIPTANTQLLFRIRVMGFDGKLTNVNLRFVDVDRSIDSYRLYRKFNVMGLYDGMRRGICAWSEVDRIDQLDACRLLANQGVPSSFVDITLDQFYQMIKHGVSDVLPQYRGTVILPIHKEDRRVQFI